MADGEDHVRKARENFFVKSPSIFAPMPEPPNSLLAGYPKGGLTLGNTVWTKAFVLYIDIPLAQRNLKRYTCYVWVKILAFCPGHHK